MAMHTMAGGAVGTPQSHLVQSTKSDTVLSRPILVQLDGVTDIQVSARVVNGQINIVVRKKQEQPVSEPVAAVECAEEKPELANGYNSHHEYEEAVMQLHDYMKNLAAEMLPSYLQSAAA